MPTRICTIGHSTRSFDEVLEMLRGHDIVCPADGRSFPSSTKPAVLDGNARIRDSRLTYPPPDPAPATKSPS
ncbi:hypothetical protein QFZ71_005888 [Streptomyces sp. V2I9]|nr:hypothetical protein [Streptomyces sp. V2I9]